MHSHRRLLVGLCVLFLSVGWHTIPIPAQSTAPAGSVRRADRRCDPLPRDRSDRAGRPLRRVRRGREQPARLLRRDRDRRAVENGQQRHQLHARLRRPARLRARRGGGGAEPAGCRLRRHRRVEQLALHLRRQRRLQVRGRRQDLDESRPPQRRTHRPDRRPPEESRTSSSSRRADGSTRRTRIAASTAPPTAARTWTKTLDHKVDGREIGAIDIAMDPVEPQRPLCRDLRQGAQALDVRRGRPRQRDLQVDRRRRDVDAADQRPSDRHARPHRPRRSRAAIRRRSTRSSRTRTRATEVTPEERRKRLAQGFGDGSIGDELYRSDDAGATWRKVVAGRRPRRATGTAAPAPAGRGAAGRGAAGEPQGRGGPGGGWHGRQIRPTTTARSASIRRTRSTSIC